MAADHINYEEDFNLRYKVPPYIVNFSQRLAAFWFVAATLIISFGLGDMLRVFRQSEYYYPTRPCPSSEAIPRY